MGLASVEQFVIGPPDRSAITTDNDLSFSTVPPTSRRNNLEKTN